MSEKFRDTGSIIEWVLVVACIGFLVYTGYIYREDLRHFFLGEATVRIYVDDVRMYAQVADTPEERTQGLSGTKPLRDFQGMLFIFDEPGFPGIWMKDMNYAIDIFWISDEFEIVHIEHSVSPDTYPRSFRPSKPARYVLETKAGLARKYGVEVGEEVLLPAEVTLNVINQDLSE